jgi:hypothetical protein
MPSEAVGNEQEAYALGLITGAVTPRRVAVVGVPVKVAGIPCTASLTAGVPSESMRGIRSLPVVALDGVIEVSVGTGLLTAKAPASAACDAIACVSRKAVTSRSTTRTRVFDFIP